MVGSRSSVLGNLVAMDHFTGAHCAFCVKRYYKNGDSCAIVRRLFRREFRLHNLNQCPKESVIRSWVTKFEATGSALKQKPARRPRATRTEDTIERVRAAISAHGIIGPFFFKNQQGQSVTVNFDRYITWLCIMPYI